MDVRPITPRPVAGDVLQSAPTRVAARDLAQTLAAVLNTTGQLSQADVDRLIRILDVRLPPQQQTQAQDLLLTAIRALGNGNAGAALELLATLVQLDPARAGTLPAEPGLAQIRADVTELLTRLESRAGSEARDLLAQAAKALESRNAQPLPGWETAPRSLLAAANRLYDAGGYVNYVRAAALARAIVEAGGVPVESAAPGAAGSVDRAVPLPLSPSDTDKLVRILEPPAAPERQAMAQRLLRAAVVAARQGDVEGALKAVTEFVRLDPYRAVDLRVEPELEPVRAQVEQLLRRLESLAGLDAQTRLTAAAKAVEAWGRQFLPGWDATPEMLLAVANRLYDAGGYVNYVRAASVAQVVEEGVQTPAPDRAPAMAALARLTASLGFSPSDTEQVIRLLAPPDSPQEPAILREFLRNVVSAAQKGDPAGALKQLEEFVRLEPNRAAVLRAAPELEPVRAQVELLLARLESLARGGAQSRLADAARALESGGRQPLTGWDTAPQTVLAAANQLYEAGGYVNYIYAAMLAQVVIERGRVRVAAARAPAAASPRMALLASAFGRRLKAMWARVPLLVMLLAWFVLGLAAIGVAALLHYFEPEQYPAAIVNLGFGVWGMGFVALVGFGFWMRIRREFVNGLPIARRSGDSGSRRMRVLK